MRNVFQSSVRQLLTRIRAFYWLRFSRKPGGLGNGAARWLAVQNAIANNTSLEVGASFPGLAERIIELPWIFQRVAALAKPGTRVLDAGSILNHGPILKLWQERSFPPVSIVTLAYEGSAQVSDRIRYEFADLRNLPYRDDLFSIVLCISTLEHVGMDNTRYGASPEMATSPRESAVGALRELRRVAAPNATLLLSVPVGEPSNRGWFRVISSGELHEIVAASGWKCDRARYFRATLHGWIECEERDVDAAGYNEPSKRKGLQTAPAYVAAAEAVGLVELRNT